MRAWKYGAAVWLIGAAVWAALISGDYIEGLGAAALPAIAAGLAARFISLEERKTLWKPITPAALGFGILAMAIMGASRP